MANKKLDISKIDAARWLMLASAVLGVASTIVETKQRAADNHDIAAEVAQILFEKMNERNDA